MHWNDLLNSNRVTNPILYRVVTVTNNKVITVTRLKMRECY